MDQDSETLSNIFPTEVWMLVFDKFIEEEAFSEVEDSINASPYFRTLLETERTTVLFPKVFESLGINYENKPTDAYSENYYNLADPKLKNLQISSSSSQAETDEERFNFRRSQIPNSSSRCGGERREYAKRNASVLKLRLVCKTWNKGVDQFYQKLPYHYKMNHDFDREDSSESDTDSSESDTDSSEPGNLIHIYCRDKTDYSKFEGNTETWSAENFICKQYEKTVQFLKHFEATHSNGDESRNPFVGRAITIQELPHYSHDWNYYELPATQNDYAFWNTITSILERYGDHIWYCVLSPRNKFSSIVEYYRTIRKWISLMPNLKVLEIEYHFKVSESNNLSIHELTRLQKQIRINPMPKLEMLTSLKTYKIPAPIFNELMKQNFTRLNLLQIHGDKDQIGYDPCSNFKSSLALRKLSIQFHSKAEFNLLFKSSGRWNLEKLYLDYAKTAEFIEWSKVFKFVEEKFGNKVANLMINLPVAKTERQIAKLVKEAVKYRLNMPFVKRLKLIIRNRVPIDFILPMKDTLEILEVYLEYGTAEKNEMEASENPINKCVQTIKLVGFEHWLYESNIWELFPKLKRFNIGNDKSDTRCGGWMTKRETWEKIRANDGIIN